MIYLCFQEGGPSSSTPMKDSTPTNQVSDHLEQFNDTEEVPTENSESQVIQIGEIFDDKDIVESSDCQYKKNNKNQQISQFYQKLDLWSTDTPGALLKFLTNQKSCKSTKYY